MSAPDGQPWFGTVIFIGILYGVIGIIFAFPSNHVHMWRLAAWISSAVVYAAHIGHEHFALRHTSRSTAFHVAVAVGIGGFALAVAATVHSLLVPPNYQRWRFLIALVVWPIITALPAFLVAFVVAAVLARLLTKRSAG
jgi:hypothetical protein